MTRTMRASFAVLAIAVTVALAAASGVQAAPAASAICPAFTKFGLKFQWEVVGSHFTCKSAKPIVLRLIKQKVPNGAEKVPLHHGPKKYHCYAEDGVKHHVAVGVCYLGTLQFPKSGFSWFGS